MDPLTASASIRDPQTFNRYAYVLNSPYKFTDPLGLLPLSTLGACGNFCKNWDGGAAGWTQSYDSGHRNGWELAEMGRSQQQSQRQQTALPPQDIPEDAMCNPDHPYWNQSNPTYALPVISRATIGFYNDTIFQNEKGAVFYERAFGAEFTMQLIDITNGTPWTGFKFEVEGGEQNGILIQSNEGIVGDDGTIDLIPVPLVGGAAREGEPLNYSEIASLRDGTSVTYEMKVTVYSLKNPEQKSAEINLSATVAKVNGEIVGSHSFKSITILSRPPQILLPSKP